MERSRRIGMMVSGGAHLGAILWLMLGGLFFSHDLPPPVASAEVSLISSAEFSALAAAAPRAPTEAPPQPSPPVAAEAPPAPEATAEATPEAAPAPPPDAAPADAAPDVTDLAPPATVVEDAPPTPPAPPVEEPAARVLPEVSPRAVPKPAPRVAPTPAEAPEPDAEPAPDRVAERAPDPQANPLPVEPETPAAPPEAGDVLLTEENRDQTKVASAAPLTSTRPKSKPVRPKPAKPAKPAPAEPKPAAPAQTAAKPATEPARDAVAEALAEALAGAASDTPAPGTGTAASGPPLTGGEKDALVVAVKQCWNVGALSTDALRTIVTLGVSMDPSGRPVEGSIRLLGYEGGDATAARGAFDAGRRAILRCARDGYPLPAEKYDQWREVEIVFNPERMRIK